jgi:Tfp pilus assembly protein PilF
MYCILLEAGLLLQQERGDYIGARALFDQALKASPNDMATLNNMGLLLEEGFGDDDAAESIYKRAVEVDPRDVATLCNYGGFLKHAKGDGEAAVAMFKRAAAVDVELAKKCMKEQDKKMAASKAAQVDS